MADLQLINVTTYSISGLGDRILNLDDGRYALTDEIAAIMSVCWVLDYPGALVIEVING